MKKGAVLSRDRLYRYALWREWDTSKGTCVFIGLNPSAADAKLVVAAWGNHGSFLNRDKTVLKLLKDVPLKCFKITSKGQPAHPLYQAKNTVLINFNSC